MIDAAGRKRQTRLVREREGPDLASRAHVIIRVAVAQQARRGVVDADVPSGVRGDIATVRAIAHVPELLAVAPASEHERPSQRRVVLAHARHARVVALVQKAKDGVQDTLLQRRAAQACRAAASGTSRDALAIGCGKLGSSDTADFDL